MHASYLAYFGEVVIMQISFVIGVDDDFQAGCHIIEHENMNSAASLQKAIDDYKMISDVQMISDDNANDDDSLCGSFYSGEWKIIKFLLLKYLDRIPFKDTWNIRSTSFLLSYLFRKGLDYYRFDRQNVSNEYLKPFKPHIE